VLSLLPLPLLAELVSREPPGSGFDENATAESVTQGLDLSGKVFAITGANSGLGYETMRVLALRGAHVIGIARSAEKAETACASITGRTTPMHLDLADFDSVVACAGNIRNLGVPLDGLVCNAGVVSIPERQLVDGIERHFAINHLGHFILANQLLETVLRSDQGRFVFVSSRAHRDAPAEGILFDDLGWQAHEYDPQSAYGHSKLANALCSRALAHRLSRTTATANALHPGVIVTNAIRNMPGWKQWLARNLGWLVTKTVEEGAATQTYLASHPSLDGVRGYFFSDCNPVPAEGHIYDDVMAERLWQVSADLTAAYLPDA
jgi:NAD(P)-dependent dehydrogenase (short-subunit alcohol dehydrogenase family)